MKADTLNLQQLFSKDVRYEIPQFQRPYVWEQEAQWGPLWDDVLDTAEEYLEDQQAPAHFMGAVVLQQRSTTAMEIERRIVVDGQQRLTTLQLLLDAVQEVFGERGYRMPALRMSRLVLNNEVYYAEEPEQKFKVWPTVYDRAAFQHAMQDELPSSDYQTSLIVQAHDFFKDQVRLWLDNPRQVSPDDRVSALEQAVVQLLELVVIDLDPNDAPHVIFETLNARGTPLLQSDLVKNLILYQSGVGVDSDSEEASHLWNFDRDDWWRAEVMQGRLRRPRVDVFLNYWMVTRTRKDVTANNVFSEFRAYAEDETNGKSIRELAEDISAVGTVYRNLEEMRYPEIATFLYRRQIMQVGILTPVLLWLFSANVPRQQITKALRALESYLVRRMICRITPKDYNRLFVGLLVSLEANGAEYAGDTTLEYLANQDAYVRQWPDNQMLESEFLSAPLYRMLTRGRLRIVLEGIEAELRTDWAESQSVPRNLTIEHLMPQGWRQNRADWGLPEGTEDPIRAAGNRDRLIHSIGNLTLCTGPLNSSMSNGPWLSKPGESGKIKPLGKREELDKHSVLFLNKELTSNDAPAVWDEAAIAARARRLCQAAIKVWPHADGI